MLADRHHQMDAANKPIASPQVGKHRRNARKHLSIALYFLAVFTIFLGKADPVYAFSICLDPRGCQPKTRGECLKQSASAKTEAAAKALIHSCSALPNHTKDECEKFTQNWAQHLQATNGIEWGWPNIDVKYNCQSHYRETFKPSAWLTDEYCRKNYSKILSQARKVDPVTGRSVKLTEAAASVGLDPLLNDRSIIEVIQRNYYPKNAARDVAVHMGSDDPPDVHLVAKACGHFVSP